MRENPSRTDLGTKNLDGILETTQREVSINPFPVVLALVLPKKGRDATKKLRLPVH